MQYKSITLELLQSHPHLYDQLISRRTLLTALEHYSIELQSRHLAWQDQLLRSRQESSTMLIASQALEIALKEMETVLPPESALNDNEPLSLDEAMSFLKRHMSPA